MKNIKFRKINNDFQDDYISPIKSIIGKTKNVTIKAFISKFNVYELDNTLFSVLTLNDNTSHICALLVGDRSDDLLKNIIKDLKINEEYIIRGNVTLIDESIYQDFDRMLDKSKLVKKSFFGDRLFNILAIKKAKFDNGLANKE